MLEKRGIHNSNSVIPSSKRGMSPLIATVLLIAFAVALGAMIINLGSNYGGNSGPDCSKVSLAVPVICYAQNLIKMTIANDGNQVEAIALKVSDDKTDTKIELKNSRLAKGKELKIEVPYVKSSKTSVSLTPSVLLNDKVTACPEPSVEIKDIIDCKV